MNCSKHHLAPCGCCPGPVGPGGARGLQGIKGDKGDKGDAGTPGTPGGGPGSIVRTFAIDGGNPGVDIGGGLSGFPADGTERDVIALPFVLPPGTGGTIDVVGSYSFHVLDTDPSGAFPDAGFSLKLDPGNTMLGRSFESAQPGRSGSGALRRRLTGLAPGAYTIRLTVQVAVNAGASITIPGPPSAGNDYASIYVQEIAP